MKLARMLSVLLLFFAAPAPAQVNDPAYANYFLVGRFGEICTMCEVVVLCEAGEETQHDAIPAQGSFTIYHIQTRTFWSQVSTIWEWFVANWDSDSLAAGHSRPVDAYAVTNGAWSRARTIDARVSLEPAEIALGEHVIDRVERRWLRMADSAPIGYCQRMPLWESLDVITEFSGVQDK